MAFPPARTAAQRKTDTLAKLAEPAADVWVASAGDDGAYLVPLSLGWTGERLLITLEATSRTARNVVAAKSARLGLGPTRDVVLIDAVLEAAHDLAAAPSELIASYVAQADWDPREEGGGYQLLVLRPVRIQAWREANELSGRTLMRDGAWTV
jgi:hypothetical protein